MIRWSSILMSLVVFTASIPTRAQSATPATPPSAENTQILKNTESFIRELFAWGPDFKLKIGPLSPSPSQYFYTVPIEVTVNGQTDKGTVFVSKDGKTFLRGEMFNTAANPYAENLAKLHTEGNPSVGPTDAKVTVVIFSDFQCPHCRELSNTLATVIPEYPQVHFVFKDFPLTQIHPWAEAAAIGAHCAYMQSPKAFAPLDAQIFAEQDLLSAENIWEKLISYATQAGLDPDAFKTCMSSPEAKAAVDASHREGEALNVTSTPTLFVNGHPLIGGDKATLEQYIKYELSAVSSRSPSVP
ncbi:MAG: thioredoxin domain-containing protein [Candidatus Acidiferrales bacterium]